jgi:hypothetical protein
MLALNDLRFLELTGFPFRLDITPSMCRYKRSCSSGYRANNANEKHNVCAVVCKEPLRGNTRGRTGGSHLMSRKKKDKHVSWEDVFQNANDHKFKYPPISSSSPSVASLSSSPCAASRRPLNRSWRSSTLSAFLRASTISSMYCCSRYAVWITRTQLGQP